MSENIIGSRITLKVAVERFCVEPGAPSNAYDWYRKQAHACGRVSIGGTEVRAVKVRNQWTVASSEVDNAITAHRYKMAEQHQATADYKAHILHGQDGESISTDWGGYRISGAFHFAWSWYEIGTRKSDGTWYCNTCFKPAQSEHDRGECHTCSDWGGCGRDCTLSRIFCSLSADSLVKLPSYTLVSQSTDRHTNIISISRHTA